MLSTRFEVRLVRPGEVGEMLAEGLDTRGLRGLLENLPNLTSLPEDSRVRVVKYREGVPFSEKLYEVYAIKDSELVRVM